MLVEVPRSDRAVLRPLFAGFPGLRGALDAALEGTMGRAWADGARRPTFGMIELDFFLVAGDWRAPGADDACRMMDPSASIVAGDRSWEAPLRDVWGERLRPHTRVEFEAPSRWDRQRLRALTHPLPAGFELKRIDMECAPRFAELADSLVYNFASLEDFVARGVGFGIEHDGWFVSGCASFAISSRSVEFEIQTHADFRRRGLALAAASAMIEHCLDAGLGPCWDAHNEMSAALAERLGFVNPKPYTAYELRSRL